MQDLRCAGSDSVLLGMSLCCWTCGFRYFERIHCLIR